MTANTQCSLKGTRVFLLQYSKDTGSREDWNVFYTPVEVFTSATDRHQRIEELAAKDSRLDFEKTEVLIGHPFDD